MQRVCLRSNQCLLAILASIFTSLAISAAMAYPKPHSVPVRWEFDFESGPLRLYIDPDPAPGDPAAYWYFTYKVVNATGRERMWAPRLTLFTDQGEIMNSGEGVPPNVERELIQLLGNELLQRQNRTIGTLFTGERNAIEGLAVWPADALNVTEVDLFVSGISGETAEVANPITGAKQVLAKTMHRSYVIPGDPVARGDDPIELREWRWVMR